MALSNRKSSASKGPDRMRPAPTAADWNVLKEAYRKVKKNTDPDDVYLYQTFDANDNGFKIPFEVRQSPGKGRGIFCTEFVRKGQFVSEARCGRFYTEEQWREFLTSVPHELAKDCTDWAYVEKFKGRSAVWLDFCEAALMNHGDRESRWKKLCCSLRRSRYSEFAGSDKANVEEKIHNGRWISYAIRDIHAGEEILCDYEDFHNYDEPLSWFEDTWDEYWEHGSSSSSSSSSD